MLVLFAAHQGEEFVLALPAIMLVGAFFLLRWANQGEPDDSSDSDADSDEVASEELAEEEKVQSGR
jgi:hypothetical protein